jgi:2,4-dienoyl-CoA reductase-like NADH-dependent reductase (Old Yellow Enzyme family)
MPGKAFSPFKLRALELKNRFIKTATYEGMGKNGLMDDRLPNLHAGMAAMDVALTTIAYGAVNADGLTHEHQLVIDKQAIPQLMKLADAVHVHGGKISIQLTHCGYFTRSTRFNSRKPLAPSPVLNKYGIMRGRPIARSMTVNEIRQTAIDFASAASTAKNAGFDAVEIHMGHGYLLSQFLSPAVNRRTDEYGGKPENRIRFPLEVADAVRREVGDDFPVLCKLNLEDDIPGGFTLADCIKLVHKLEMHGVDAVILSGGFTSLTPFYLLRGKVPLREMIASETNYLQKAALFFFGKSIIREYAFTENFFLPLARKVRQSTRMPLVYVGGIISAAGVKEVMDSGFDLIAIGRALIAEPDFIRKVMHEHGHRSPCDQCNKCVGYMEKTGVKCFLDDPK